MEIQKIYNGFLNNPKSDIREHLSTLIEYGNKVNTITEFGVRWGQSTTAWILSNPKRFVCYDTVLHPRLKRYLIPFNDYAKKNNIDFRFIQADVLNITIDKTDILFIDTFHTYDQLKKELLLHSKNVLKYIILHDTMTFGLVGEDKNEPGLLQAVDEFLIDDSWEIEKVFENNNGLTILKRV